MRPLARRRRLIAAAFCAAWALACGARGERPRTELPTAPIIVGNERVTVELAATRAQRGRGLMFRETLAEDGGMLFLFPDEQVLEFWMRNTRIPLSIAFADASGRIVRIADSFDAITHRRPYHAARSLEWALTELKRCAGRQFDPELVRLFEKLVDADVTFAGAIVSADLAELRPGFARLDAQVEPLH